MVDSFTQYLDTQWQRKKNDLGISP